MKIAEKNKLIAEWYGGDWATFSIDRDCPFNKNWHWLMPVIEKLESMGYYITIQGTNCVITGHGYIDGSLRETTKLKGVYKAVFQLIKHLSDK